MRPLALLVLLLACCSTGEDAWHWRMVRSPGNGTVRYANGSEATVIAHAGEVMTVTWLRNGAELDRRTWTIRSPLPERIAGGAELTLSLEASALAGADGILELRGSEAATAGRSKLADTRRVAVRGGNPDANDAAGHFLAVRFVVNDANVSAGQPQGKPVEWVWEWTRGDAGPAPAAAAPPAGPHWRLVRSPGSGTVRFPNGPFATVITYDGGSMTVDYSFQGVAPERRTFTVLSPLPERLAGGGELTLALQASALSGTDGFLELRGHDGGAASAGRAVLRDEKRFQVRTGNPDPNDAAGHFLVVRMLVNDANTSAGRGEGRVPEWVWEWTTP